MNLDDNKERLVFRNDYNGKALYSISISHKKQDNTYENGTINCRFPKDADIPNKAKIKIHSAWIDFYNKDKVTHPYIFINKYEVVTNNQEEKNEEPTIEEIPQNFKTEYDNLNSGIQLEDKDIDRIFNSDKLELPF